MLLEFWQDVVLHEPCQCQSSVRREWNLISQCIFSLCQVAQLVSVSFDSIAGCTVLVELSFNWIFVLLFPLIHLKIISKFASANFLKLSLPEQVVLRFLHPLKDPSVFGDVRKQMSCSANLWSYRWFSESKRWKVAPCKATCPLRGAICCSQSWNRPFYKSCAGAQRRLLILPINQVLICKSACTGFC